mgnify:CR=1 FL=1
MISVLATGKSFGVSNINSVKNWQYDSGCSHTGPQGIYLSMPDGKKAYTTIVGAGSIASQYKRINVEFEAYNPADEIRFSSEAGVKLIVKYPYVKSGKHCVYTLCMDCTSMNNETLYDEERQVYYINFEHILPFPLIDAGGRISVSVINNSGNTIILREVYFSSSRDISIGQTASAITSAATITSWRVYRGETDHSVINSVHFVHDDDNIDIVELFANEDHELTGVRINNGLLITGSTVYED